MGKQVDKWIKMKESTTWLGKSAMSITQNQKNSNTMRKEEQRGRMSGHMLKF